MFCHDAQTLDGWYNNRLLVPEFPAHVARWQQDSQAARVHARTAFDVPYGPGGNERLDIFPAALSPSKAPVLVFLHGGYWRSMDKADHSFIAPAWTRRGVCVVIPNYDLCPAVSVPQIVLQTVAALAWVYRHIGAYGGDARRITLVGHSAGGHLVAMLLRCLWPFYAADLPTDLVKNGLSISGLFELQSIRKAPYLQSSLRLTPAQVKKASPAWLPVPLIKRGRGVLYSVAGGLESPAFLYHNRLIQEAWGRAAVPVSELLPGLNHFSILESLIQPGARLYELTLDLLGLSRG
jgi:arylformamidase